MPRSTFSPLVRHADQGGVFHIVDVETTGLSPGPHRVIELATVTVRNGAIVDRFETLIDPGVEVPSFITNLTGITPAMLVGAPAPDVALRRWLDYLGGTGHFVAHNAEFDWGFLQYECRRAELDWPFQRKYCTVKLSRQCLPHLRRHKLESLIQYFGIQVSDRHRALADVEATATIFLKFLDHLRAEEGDVLEQVVPAAPDPWDALLDYLKDHSVTTAAMVAQHAQLGDREPDGTIILRIRPVFLKRLTAKQPMIEAGLQSLLGPDTRLRFESF